MEKRTVTINGHELPFYHCHTLVIGSGAAALNCACHLVRFGVKDVLIVTAKLGGGTSSQAGSDKQTYYKLSLFGEEKDSVYEMARTLCAGGAIHGDLALIEAALSAQEFFHLVACGVPFPHNLYGGYVGYKTDHDPKQRAISSGPWTSQQMFAGLLAETRALGIPILDRHEVIFLLTDREGPEPRVVGALALDQSRAELGLGAVVLFQAENIVMATGGPGGIYAASVYPEDQLGSTGVALEAGAAGVNLGEWQYGLASAIFRWNLSGSYQQVIPAYFSTNADGTGRRISSTITSPACPSWRQVSSAKATSGLLTPGRSEFRLFPDRSPGLPGNGLERPPGLFGLPPQPKGRRRAFPFPPGGTGAGSLYLPEKLRGPRGDALGPPGADEPHGDPGLS